MLQRSIVLRLQLYDVYRGIVKRDMPFDIYGLRCFGVCFVDLLSVLPRSGVLSCHHCFFQVDYSKAYLRHLFVSDEYLGKQIATIHNLGFYMWLVREARRQIIAGTFYAWKEKMVKQMATRL